MEILYLTILLNGLQISRFDPFCSETIRSDRATITISLQSGSVNAPGAPTRKFEWNGGLPSVSFLLG